MPSTMEICSSALRGLIISPPGKILTIADLSNIEGRVLAWLTGEEWKLQAFRDFDKGVGHDLYDIAYSMMFNIDPILVNDKQRQVGKVRELAMGYQGGVSAFVRFALAYRLDLEAMAEEAYPHIPNRLKTDAEEFRKKWRKPGDKLSNRAFDTCNSFKQMWREDHPKTVKYWYAMEAVCISAAQKPGVTHHCYKHKIRCDGNWLRISFPNGTCLCYPFPRLTPENKLTYYGKNQFTQKWEWLSTYGGKITENATQKTAGDILKYVMQGAETEGFETGLTVHDEIVAEADANRIGVVEQLSKIMSTPPDWCADLPLAAKGFKTIRYKKG